MSIEDFNSLGYFLHNLKTLILKMMVVLWDPNTDELSKLFLFFKSFKNLSLVIGDVYNPFIFCFNNIFIPFNHFCCFFRILRFFQLLCLDRQIHNFFFISSFDERFDKPFRQTLSVKPFHIYKQKNKHFSIKSKTKISI